MTQQQTGRRLLQLNDVLDKTSISKTTLWRYVSKGEFPRPVPMLGKRKGWVESEIDAWIEERIAKRDAQ